jgi:iron complex outermembrane receptor protein
MSTGFGRWTTRANLSYIDSYKQDGTEYAGTNGQGTSTLPRVRGQLAFDWDYRGLSATAAVNYIRSFRQDFLVGSFYAPGDPRFQNQVYPERVPSHTTFDIFAKYQLTKNLSISGAVINVNDRMPPYDPGFSSTFLYDFSVFDVRGRQVRVGLTLKL